MGGEAAGEHPGHAKFRHGVPRRTARPAVSDARGVTESVILRLLSYSIRLGGPGREKALATVLPEPPDLVVFQEATGPGVIERCRARGWSTGAAMPGLRSGS